MKRQRPKSKGKGSSPRPKSKQNSGKSAQQTSGKSAQETSGKSAGQQTPKVAKPQETAKAVPVAAQKEIAKAAQAALAKAPPASKATTVPAEPTTIPTTTTSTKSKTPTVPTTTPTASATTPTKTKTAAIAQATTSTDSTAVPTAPLDPKEQRWSELQLEVPSQDEDMACWVLVKQCGALGCEVVPGKSGKVSIRASYEKSKLNENTVRSTIAILEEYGLSETLRSLKVKDIPQEDWLAKWKEGFEPFRVGTKFLICPVWRQEGLSDALTSGRIVILIEPGMAFGTGLHATTQFCLRALESYPPHGDIVDVGTGSGILAMAAKMLNPKARVIGVDTDPVAIETAKTDLDFNELVGLIELRLGSVETVADRTFDMILSNLTCEDIVALLPDYVRLLKPNGKVICAGILKEKMSLLESALKRFPLNIEQSETFGNWVGVVLQR